jgi:hypothetical protein
MKFDFQLEGVLIRNPAIVERLGADAELSTRQLHPRIPSVVAWSSQWVVCVAVACPHPCASLRPRFECTATDVCLFGVLRSRNVLGHDAEQRTLRAAVGLLCRQLN